MTLENSSGSVLPAESDFQPEGEVKITSAANTNDNNLANIEGETSRSLSAYAGILLTLVASLFFSIATLIVKVLNDEKHGFHSFASSFWRYLGVAVPSLPILIFMERKRQQEKKDSIFTPVWPLFSGGRNQISAKGYTVVGLLIRGVLGASAVILRYYSLHYLNIADATVLSYSTPILVTVLAYFCLGEKLGVIPVVGIFLSLVGVIVMTRPPFITGAESYDSEHLIGIAIALGSLVCSSLVVILTRQIIHKVHYSLMTLAFGCIGCFLALAVAYGFNVFKFPATLYQCSLIGGLMGLSFLGQLSMTLALKFEQAGPVSIIRSCDVIFAFALQIIFLGVTPDELSILGGIAIASVISLIGIRKWLITLDERDSIRRKLRFFLL